MLILPRFAAKRYRDVVPPPHPPEPPFPPAFFRTSGASFWPRWCGRSALPLAPCTDPLPSSSTSTVPCSTGRPWGTCHPRGSSGRSSPVASARAVWRPRWNTSAIRWRWRRRSAGGPGDEAGPSQLRPYQGPANVPCVTVHMGSVSVCARGTSLSTVGVSFHVMHSLLRHRPGPARVRRRFR